MTFSNTAARVRELQGLRAIASRAVMAGEPGVTIRAQAVACFVFTFVFLFVFFG